MCALFGREVVRAELATFRGRSHRLAMRRKNSANGAAVQSLPIGSACTAYVQY